MKIKNTISRKFEGKIDNFVSKEENNFEKKHLKAYLRGDIRYPYKQDQFRNPIVYKVQQEYFTYK